MATSNEKRLKEGDKLVAEAEKCLKTNWLKWNPDYDNAAHAFEKAALAYRNAKAYDKARDTYERAAETHYKNHAMFQAGKAYEQASSVCKDMQAVDQAAAFLQKASTKYHESGHPDTAGQVLIKAAKLVETVNPYQSAQYYLATAEIHEIEEKYRDSAKVIRSALNMYSRARDFDKMLEAVERLKQLYNTTGQTRKLYEVAVIEVVVQLHRNDASSASMAYRSACSIPGFVDSDEASALDRLIETYQDREEEEFHECCDNAIFRTMDNEIAKLARDLKKQLNVGFDSPSHMPSLASSKRGAAASTTTAPETAAALSNTTTTAAAITGLRTVASAREGRLDSSGSKPEDLSPVESKTEPTPLVTENKPEVGGAPATKQEEDLEEDSDNEDIL